MTTYEKRVAEFKNRHGIGRGPRKPADMRRNYEAAKWTRLTGDWNTASGTADADIQYDITSLRARMRDSERNNEYVSRYLNALENNVMKHGTGFSLQMKSMRPPDYKILDDIANLKIERAWKEFSKKKNCCLSGEHSMADLVRLCLRSTARDGGVMLRKIIDPKANEFGFVLRPIEIDFLDHNYTAALGNGNRVIMGVEKNSKEQVLAYHLLAQHPGDRLFGSSPSNRVRVPADEIIHYFLKERLTQTVGVPWAAPSLMRLHILRQYELAEAVASRRASEKGGYFYSERGDVYQGQDEITETENGPVVTGTLDDSEPGMMDQLPPGMKFQAYDPTHPTTQYGEFTKNALIGSAAGMNMSYATLTGDLSEANYSSMRSGKQDEQEGFRRVQSHMIDHLMLEIFEPWLETSMTSGAINLPMSKFDQFNQPCFRGRRWPWVDPQKDITAALMAINGGLDSRTRYTEENTDADFEELCETLKSEQELAAAAGLSFVNPNTGGLTNQMPDDQQPNAPAPAQPAS